MKREGALSLIVDYLSFMCVAGGISAVLLRALHLPYGVANTFVILSLFYVVCAAVFFNWKTALAALCLLILSGLVWLHLHRIKGLVEWYEDNATPFFDWLGMYAWLTTPYKNVYGLVLAMGIWFGVGLSTFVFTRKLPSAIALGLIVMAAFGVLWGLGHGYILPYMAVSTAGVGAIMARSAARSRKTQKSSRWQLQAFALGLAALTALASLAITPADTYPWRKTWAERAFGDVNDLLAPYTGFTRPRSVYGISQSGFLPLGDRLGGPVELGGGVALEVYTPYPLLLRGSIYSYYTGQQWLDVPHGADRRLGGALSRQPQANAFDWDTPALNALGERELEGTLYAETDITIVYKRSGGNTLFSVDRVLGITSPEEDFIPYFAGDAETYVTRPLKMDTAYTVATQYYLREDPAFSQTINELGGGQARLDFDKQTEINDYLQLQDDMPIIVRQTAQLVAGEGTPYQRAQRISAFLHENFRYTLKPTTPPADADFVAYMLETGEGYCTYFASTMAVMCRSVGIPSRYVEGYMCASSVEGYPTVVTDAEAHAWVEVFLSGIGWVAFDPTPVSYEAESSGVLPIGSSGYEDELVDEFEEFALSGIFASPTQPQVVDETPLPLWPFAVALAGIIILFIATVRIWHMRRHALGHNRRRLPETQRQLSHYYREILAILVFYDCKTRRGETPLNFARRVDEWMRPKEGTFADVANIWMCWHYGGIAPSAEQIAFMHRFLKEQDRMLRYMIGFFPFFFQRCLRPTAEYALLMREKKALRHSSQTWSIKNPFRGFKRVGKVA